MKDLKKIQEFFSKSLEENTFKKGDKVTYLGHPGEITGINKEMTGAITYNVAYDKGNGRTKVSNLSNKGGEIKPIKEGKQLDQVDFAKVVKAVEQTGHPVTVLLVPKFNEIEIITGMDAPDDMLRDLSNAVDSLGYSRNDIFIAADSSNLSRREYSDIESVNEMSMNERIDFDKALDLRAIKVEIEDEIIQLRREMEDEGDESKANYYGGKLNKLEDKLAKVKKQLDDYDMNESVGKSKMPTQSQVDRFFTLTQNETHYLNSKLVQGQKKTSSNMEVEPWDEYDLSNWNSLVRKAKAKGKSISENDSYARVSKPRFVKDKNNPNFLNVYIDYDLGPGGSSIALGKETMTGQIRRATAIKAKELAFDVARDLKTKYNLEDIDVQDLENGKIHIFAVSDDFIDMDPNMLSEAKKETGVDMAKKQLDALGVKYEMSKTDKVRPFKVIYKPINKSDEFYDKFEDIVDLFNLKGFVKSSMNENFPGPGEVVDAKYLNNAMLDYFNRMNIKLLINTKTEKGIKGGVGTMYGDLVFNGDDIKLKDIVSVEIIESSISEAKKEDAIDTITMDVPLFLRVLEYSREDAQKDIDLHDVTDKAISLGKERGILSMEDYEEIVGAAEKVDEANVTWSTLHRDNANEKLLKQSKLSSSEYQKAKKLQGFKADNYKWNTDEDLYVKVVEEGMGGQLDEPFFIEISVRDARKALDLFQDRYRNSNIDMYGSNVYAADTPEDIYDLYYDLMSQDIEVLDYNVEDEDFDYDSEYEDTLMEANVPSNIAEFAKRKGVSSLVRKVAGWAEKVGARIAGGTAVGKNYSTLVLDLDYKQQGEIRINTDEETIELYDEPVYDFKSFQRVYIDGKENNLKEAKNTSLDSKTIQQIKDDIKGFPKYQKRGFESFKKEVRERYKITPKQLEDILHGELTESKEEQLSLAEKIVNKIKEERPGLWANIHAQRERGEKPARKGSKDYKSAVAAGKRINKEK